MREKSVKFIKYLGIFIVCYVFLGIDAYFSTWLFAGFCIGFSLYDHSPKSVVFSSLCGLLCDMASLSAPFCALLYLYISLGCVWCREIFLHLKGIWIVLVGFLVSFIVRTAFFIVEWVNFKTITMSVYFVGSTIVMSATGGIIALSVYNALKRLRF